MRGRRGSLPVKRRGGAQKVSERSSRDFMRMSIGIHAVWEALKVRPSEVVRLKVRKNWESGKELQDLVHEARRHKIVVEEYSQEALDRVGSHNQGVICEIKGRPLIEIEQLGMDDRSIILALDGVEDPHNLGAILRTAWLMGVEAVLLPSDRAVGLVPTVSKVSCGGIEHVPVLEVPNLANALGKLKEKNFWVFGLAAEGKSLLKQVTIPSKIVWVLGAEDKGIRITTARSCDELIAIPQVDNAASYNVSVVAGITLYETCRQLGNKKV